MKTYSLAALLLAAPLTAQQPTAPQQQTGHELSTEVHASQSTLSAHNNKTGNTHGTINQVESDTEIQIGNVIYESAQFHREIVAGKDYPATIETDKRGSPKKVDLVVGEKTYTYRITGTREAKAN
jgi:hypothetical protein